MALSHERLAEHIEELDKLGLLPENWFWHQDKVSELIKIVNDLMELCTAHKEEIPEIFENLERLSQQLSKIEAMIEQKPSAEAQETEADVVNNLIGQIKELVTISPEKVYKVPFEESLKSIPKRLRDSAHFDANKRLEALKAIYNEVTLYFRAIDSAMNRIEEESGWEALKEEWYKNNPPPESPGKMSEYSKKQGDFLKEKQPKELQIHDLRNSLTSVGATHLLFFEDYKVLDSGEIGDPLDSSNNPITHMLCTSFPPDPDDPGRRDYFKPEHHFELAEMLEERYKEFRKKMIGKGQKPKSMLESIGPEAYQNAIRILDEEFAKLKKKHKV
ncbi:hypothetical protein KY339_00360 [Candidatus Woesearchaeota archaeon]|nr:hypothetical protein [Candidatus Woesearchaeota archaeon]